MEATPRERTELCILLGIDVPIIQAPIGSVVSPQLVASVGNAGALGMLASTWVDAARLRADINEVRAVGSGRFGANFVLDFPVADNIAACLDEGVDIISTFWGDPAEAHQQIAAAGALHMHSVGSVAEARRAAEIGVDVIVAQGWEAGGHVRGQVSTLALVPAVVDAVSPIPVVAAGGIGDGRGIAAALMLGAQAGWIGTRFILADESRAHDVYRSAVIDAAADDAVHTMCFDGGWPDAAHRAVSNSTMQAWSAAGQPAGPDRPGEQDVVATTASGHPIRRYDDSPPLRNMVGDLTAMALYAGQSVELVTTSASAEQIVADLMRELHAALTFGRSFP
jgi:NAD(P)H-dependent flavin oxidoreductase YrpB (nitropropane dioxygenase family)